MPAANRRSYNSPTRRRQAGETRRRITEAARRLFVERGYAGATVDAIAGAAGVAPQTVTAVFGNKRGVLAEVVSRAAFGGTHEELIEEVRAMPGPEEHARLAARIARQAYEAASDELDLLRGAGAVAPELAEVEREVAERRLEGQAPFIDHLVQLGALRPELDVDTARDAFWALTSHDLYRMLVRERGWSPARYESWVAGQLAASLLRSTD